MNKILFPTTYSIQSKVAFRYAQNLAQYFEASITLVHIYQSPTPSVASNMGLIDESEESIMEDFAETQWSEQLSRIKAFANDMSAKQFHDIPLDYIVTDGNVVEELMEIQRQNNFDLVVMGMRRHGLSEKLFGNTSYRLIDKINCPLLLIPPNSYYMGLKKIIYGTAFQIGDDEAIEYLLDWCQAFVAKLHLLHIHKKENVQLATRKMEILMSDFKEEQKVGIISTQLQAGQIKPVMEQYVQVTNTDILAVHHRTEGFWKRISEGSMTKMLAEELEIPLLVLKSKSKKG